jgi:exoribonuclease R
LIGTNKNYTHSTSPLRRTSDCIVHFLLKAKYLQIDSPFSNDELKTYANKLVNHIRDNFRSYLPSSLI